MIIEVANQIDRSYVRRTLQLAELAPDIVESIHKVVSIPGLACVIFEQACVSCGTSSGG